MINYPDTISPYFIELEHFSDQRGNLSVLSLLVLPFTPIRFFTLSPKESIQPRGKHAHKICWQLFISTKSSSKITWENSQTASIELLSEGESLLVPPWNWCEINFDTLNSSISVFASHLFDTDDYVTERPNSKAIETR